MIIESLATGKGDIRKRLIGAHNILIRLNKDDFPENIQNDFEWVMKELVKFGPLYGFLKTDIVLGSCENTMGRIKNKTGEKIAKKIRDRYIEIKEKY